MKPLKGRSTVQTASFIIGALVIAFAITLVIGSIGGIWSLLGSPQTTAGESVEGQAGTENRTTGAGTGTSDDATVQIRIRSPEAAPGLANDSAGPLFVEANMAPGATSTRCVSVTNVGMQLGDVRFYGHIEDQGLARHISFTVEADRSQAGARDCQTFKGTEIFSGSLSELDERHTDFASGVRTPDVLYPNESMSFRLTQKLEATSPQGVRARARFNWEAKGAGAPSPLREGRDPLSYQARSARAAEDDASIDRSIPQIVLEVAVAVAKRGWTWVLLLVLVIAFLVVQDRIDRRDPRLAGAKVHAEPDLAFDDHLKNTHRRTERTR